MAKKKKHKARSEELAQTIQEAVKISEINYPKGQYTIQLYVTEADGKALSKYINWNESSNSNSFRIGKITKFATDRFDIMVLQAYNINETKIVVIPKEEKPITVRFPLSNDTPSSYEDALENVRDLATDAYKSMLPGNDRKE